MPTTKTSYTHLQRALDFVNNSSLDSKKFPFDQSIKVINSLESLSLKNADIEMRYRKGDGILLFYQGVSRVLLLQTKSHIRMIAWDRGDIFSGKFLELIKRHSDKFESTHHRDYYQWRICPVGANLFIEFLDDLPKPSPMQQSNVSGRHPRYFPAEVRRLAYDEFEKDGSCCPGFGCERHYIDIKAGDRIEYDHILPAAKGGSNSYFNIQVLCGNCNRKKRDHIA
jgi:HNH endonuclease